MKVLKQTIISFGVVMAMMVPAISLANPVSAAECAKITTAIITCDPDTNNESGVIEQNAIWKLLIMVLNIMIAGVGILAVAGVVYASVLYASAADSAEQVKKAKDIIMNVVIGVLAFGLMYSLLNFLIPGGIFT